MPKLRSKPGTFSQAYRGTSRESDAAGGRSGERCPEFFSVVKGLFRCNITDEVKRNVDNWLMTYENANTKPHFYTVLLRSIG